MKKPEFSQKDLKNYPHFDRRLTVAQAEEIAGDPKAVAENKFYPFFLYHEEWQPYRTPKKGQPKPKPKSRPIRYAARRDAYILMHYRRILSVLYETRLEDLGISDCPIAYRKIPKANGGGKCNIDFAKDAFDEIERQGNCVAIALDIKGYFENLDHSIIKKIWCDLLGVSRLPDDHFTVFKNMTNYHVVDQKDVYRRLGFLKTVTVGGYEREKYELPFNKMPVQLCSPEVFREKICGGDPALPSLVRGNEDKHGNALKHGIPQGAPISDLIANFYLMDFDVAMNTYAKSKGGTYMRYSDDILLIIPGAMIEANEAEKLATDEISKCGPELRIKDAKTCIVSFVEKDDELQFSHLKGPQGKNGFEYLGFRFDGTNVYLRDSTLSRLYRKVSASAKGVARSHALAPGNKGKSAEEIMKTFNYSNFSQRFSRVLPEKLLSDDYGTWTFYSYLKRSSKTFGNRGRFIIPQARNFNKIMKSRIGEAMVKAVARRDNVK